MKYKFFSLLIVITSLGLFGLLREWQSGRKYDFEKASPNGVYRVKIQLREEEGTGTRDYIERLKVQYFKGQEIIYGYESENADQYEPSILEGMQVIEWVSDNVLYVGRDRSDQPFNDELIISNNTDEYLRHLGVSNGRFESFRVFDLAPGHQLTLLASPGFKPDRSSNYFLGYGGMTQSGKKFEGAMESKQRKSPADGPSKFHITINAKDAL